MSKEDQQVVLKLQMVLQKLSDFLNPEKKCEAAVMSDDDTTLQKLHTFVHQHIEKAGNDLLWAQSAGLVNFIHRALDVNVVNIPDKASVVAFAIKSFGSLLSSKEIFDVFVEDKILMDFYIIWPNLRNDPTLSSAALDLIEGLLRHESGLSWVLRSGVWEKLLLPSLRSTSIFVQRKGVRIISSLLLLVVDSQHFEPLVKDLLLLSDKFCEIRQHVEWSLSEEIRQSCELVLLIFKEIYMKTLGEKPLFTRLNDISCLRNRLIDKIEPHVSVTYVSHVADLIVLDSIHNFQEKVMEYGIIEQFLVDTLCSDVILLIKILFEKGHTESFFRSAVNVHKYWKILLTNIDENKQFGLRNKDSLLHLITCFQVMPISVLTKDLADLMPRKKEMFATWVEEVHCRIKIKETLKAEALEVENQMFSSLTKDLSSTIKMTIISSSSISGAADHLQLTCALNVFQGLVFLSCMVGECETSVLRRERNLLRTIIDAMRVLVEKFEIDWRKCFLSICFLFVLCKMITLENVSTQVKVLSLKAVKTCIAGFLPPVMSMLVDSENQEHNSVEQMGEVLSVCLSDTEWEVRDSALEVLVTCMTLAKCKYPYFVDWLIRFNLDTAILAALDDVEGYVRASALSTLACVVSIDKVWMKLLDENLQHRALAAVLWEDDTTVRKSAFLLVRSLYSAGRYSEGDTNTLVVNIVQRATEDIDDEIRLHALEFIHNHIKERLKKLGMVDGEFPSVTFKGGKITKLDKQEVQKRVSDIITWTCDCGYLNCLLLGMNDPVTSVVQKSQEVFIFLSQLIDKYDMKSIMPNSKGFSNKANSRKSYEGMDMHMKGSPDVEMKYSPQDSLVEVAGQRIKVTEDTKELEDIDKTISDILHSSALDNVTSIKRSQNAFSKNSKLENKTVELTVCDVPLKNSAIPIEYLMQSLDSICRQKIRQDNTTTTDMLSLLDDIMLDQCKVESPDGDDQHLRDCY